MREIVYEDDFEIEEKKRIVLKLIKVDKSEDFPEGLEFAVQFLYYKDDSWQQVARIDNQLHEGKSGVHIHILKREKVKWENMTFTGAREKVIEIGEKVIKNIMGDQDGEN